MKYHSKYDIWYVWVARPSGPALPAWPAGQISFLRGLARRPPSRSSDGAFYGATSGPPDSNDSIAILRPFQNGRPDFCRYVKCAWSGPLVYVIWIAGATGKQVNTSMCIIHIILYMYHPTYIYMHVLYTYIYIYIHIILYMYHPTVGHFSFCLVATNRRLV